MKRKEFLKLSTMGVCAMTLNGLIQTAHSTELWKDDGRVMPVLFVGHGSPRIALDKNNKYAKAWRHLGDTLPKPKAILSISAHWLTRGTYVTAMDKPRTIHDFGGFEKALYEMEYSVNGSPDLATMLHNNKKISIGKDMEWGLDHGTWCVLTHMYPQQDIPVLQMSIDYHNKPQNLYDIGKELQFLRRKGVLIFCSGNIVHNLRLIKRDENFVYDWARSFDTKSKELLEQREHKKLINYETLGENARLSIPTPDHYYPLLYALGLQEKEDTLTFPCEGNHNGSISMRSVLILRKV